MYEVCLMPTEVALCFLLAFSGVGEHGVNVRQGPLFVTSSFFEIAEFIPMFSYNAPDYLSFGDHRVCHTIFSRPLSGPIVLLRLERCFERGNEHTLGTGKEGHQTRRMTVRDPPNEARTTGVLLTDEQ